ncbi:MAG: hypothetical protein OD815_000440 [Candidatus Alkanophagales archaeon MCA70_species_2]|nr:hypothetical protein [Candidatus Alkanophaga liquidiphilum]
MGVDSHGYLADYSLGYGPQYPVGIEHEHLAVGWWGEGYFVGYYDSGEFFMSATHTLMELTV